MGQTLPPVAARLTAARIAVVVPVLDEGPRLADALAAAINGADRCIVVDGGSIDDTIDQARRAGAEVIASAPGRSTQMKAGAEVADTDVLVFVHADTILPEGWAAAVGAAVGQGFEWGRFDVRLDSPLASLRLVAAMMNWRSRVTGICTGDQAMFATRGAWLRSGGFAPIPLMEDVELSARLKRKSGRPACIRLAVRVSARRWQQRGVARTIVQMWWLRLLYFFGASPARLHTMYYRRPVR